MLTSSQIRGGRAFLNISQIELAQKADISFRSVQKFEYSDEMLARANLATIRKIKEFFEASGLKFISANKEKGLGVGLRFVDIADEDDGDE